MECAGGFWSNAVLGLGDFLIQRSTRKAGDLISLGFIGVLGTIGLLPFVWNELTFDGVLFAALPLGLLGLLHFGTSWINFEALRKGKLAVIDVILEFELVVTLFFGIFILGDVLTATQLMLIVPIFFGIILMAFRKFSHLKSRRFERGVVLAFVAALGLGLVDSLTGYSVKLTSPLLVIWVTWAIISLCSVVFILAGKKRRHVFPVIRKEWRLLGAMAVADTIAWVLYAFVIDAHSVSIATALTESYPAVALILGVWINRERLGWHQYLGALLALGASVGLALTV